MIDRAFEMVMKSLNLALESCSMSLVSSCILMQSGIWLNLGKFGELNQNCPLKE